MSYRVGHHSTSDDSTRYRSTDEIKKWTEEDNPIDRFQRYCEGRGWLDDEMVAQIMDDERMMVRGWEGRRGGRRREKQTSAIIVLRVGPTMS
jgi:TPP-dependent pyruvate/acetoin dehydrogenase alpha subunit